MATTITVKGQVTIPKRVRDSLGLKPGDRVDFVLDERGEVVVKRAGKPPDADSRPDAFDRFVGASDYKWGSTAAAMKFIRGDDYAIEMDIDPTSDAPG
jgi:AbrB family looped-hinge helix DNA binding protein